MKTLFLLRHAKSSWDDPDLKDFERPLNKRGREDIPVMAARFRERQSQLDCVICSPALRARTTATLMAGDLGFPVEDVVSNPELYFAGAGMFLKAAGQFDDECDAAMVVGHNPAITEFANAMANTEIDNIPTCGLVEISLPINSWSDVAFGVGALVEFDFPKKPAGVA
ncbi:unnamed protein product [Discosporangium mesarthrocarpum]|jgi:phosphohistidine phosphatase